MQIFNQDFSSISPDLVKKLVRAKCLILYYFKLKINIMEEQKAAIASLKRELRMKKMLNPVNRVTRGNADEIVEIVADTRNQIMTYSNKILNLINNPEPALDEAEARRMDQEMETFVTDLVLHMSALELKADEVKNAANNTTASINSNGNGNPEECVSVAKTRAVTKAYQVIEDLSKLSADMRKIEAEDWLEARDTDVEAGMKSIPTWDKKLDKIQDHFRDALDLLNQQGLTEENVPQVAEAERQLKNAKFAFHEIKTAIENQDEFRELYCNKASSSEKVSYPTFEGKDDECYQDFVKKLEHAFTQNKVRREDKVAKLREVLKGLAKKLIPETLEDIDVAYENLEKAYGDPTKLMMHLRSKLSNHGKVPRNNGVAGCRSVVEWYLQLEGILQGMLDLGAQSDNEDVKNVLYGKENIRKVGLMFDTAHTEIIHVGSTGTGRTRLKNCLNTVSSMREFAQEHLLMHETVENVPKVKPVGQGEPPLRGRANVANYDLEGFMSDDLPGIIIYDTPTRDEDCRICQQLESQGDTIQLYDNHHSNYPTGCCRFICMTTEERYDIARAARFCLKCLDPNSEFSFSDTNHYECTNYQSKFKCPHCRTHAWVCKTHRSENVELFRKIETEIRDQFSLQFVFNCSPVLSYCEDDYLLSEDDDDSHGNEDQLTYSFHCNFVGFLPAAANACMLQNVPDVDQESNANANRAYIPHDDHNFMPDINSLFQGIALQPDDLGDKRPEEVDEQDDDKTDDPGGLATDKPLDAVHSYGIQHLRCFGSLTGSCEKYPKLHSVKLSPELVSHVVLQPGVQLNLVLRELCPPLVTWSPPVSVSMISTSSIISCTLLKSAIKQVSFPNFIILPSSVLSFDSFMYNATTDNGDALAIDVEKSAIDDNEVKDDLCVAIKPLRGETGHNVVIRCVSVPDHLTWCMTVSSTGRMSGAQCDDMSLIPTVTWSNVISIDHESRLDENTLVVTVHEDIDETIEDGVKDDNIIV